MAMKRAELIIEKIDRETDKIIDEKLKNEDLDVFQVCTLYLAY